MPEPALPEPALPEPALPEPALPADELNQKTCFVCEETFTKCLRSPVICPGCDNKEHKIACKVCVKQYMRMSTTYEPSCMSCNTVWTDEFIVSVVDRSFISKGFREHKADLLLEIELSKMPATMDAAKQAKRIKDLQEENKNFAKEILSIKQKMDQNNQEIKKLKTNPNGGGAKLYEIKCPNPNNECRGILDQKNKCLLCNLILCKECNEIKGFTEEEYKDHECKPDDIETAKLIRKQSKPCPKCGVPISKIDGCDQMWCPVEGCDTAFSWKTGLVDNGVRHNPHYYQRQRELAEKGGLDGPPRQPGDVRCGGMCGHYDLNKYIVGRIPKTGAKTIRRITELHRAINHITQTQLNSAQQNVRKFSDNLDIRVRYLLGEISKNELKSRVLYNKEMCVKYTKFMHIYELMTEVGREMFARLIASTTPQGEAYKLEVKKEMAEYQELRHYCNIEFSKLSYTYDIGVPVFTIKMFEKTRELNYKRRRMEYVRGLTDSLVPGPAVAVNN